MAADIFNDLQKSNLCEGEIKLTSTTLRYEFDGFTIKVEGVPAVLCQETQEELVHGPLAVALGDMVHKLAEAAQLVVAQSPNRDAPMETTVQFGNGHGAIAPA